ncbi:phosphoethanolamine transferase [Psychroserpens sp.]
MLKGFHLKPYKNYLPFLLVFFYPWVILCFIGFFEIPFLKNYLTELIGFGLFSLILFSILLLLKNRIKFLRLFFMFLMSFLIVAKLSFYHHYSVKLSSSAWFVILETHSSEALSFLNNYFDAYTIILLIIVFLPCIGLFISKVFRTKYYVLFKAPISLKTKVVLGLLVLVFSVGIYKKFNRENLILMSLSSYKEYQTFKKQFETELAQKTSKHLEVISSVVEPQTYVVVIGESTSSWHMQLYGYHRDTNPKLSEIKDDLIIFDSVIVPNVHTIISLEKILTFSDNKTPNKKENTSIIQLANQAGFNTYWISSQRPIGFHESVAATIARAAATRVYTNTENHDYQILDGSLLPELDIILNDEHKKRLIFVHLIGTHLPYDKRYPESFNFFKDDEIKSQYKHEKAFKNIITYDNAIRYNDHIVRSIIDKVKSKKAISYVTYLSDHGDEVYDTMDFLGHNEYHATRPMYEVPFLVWFSGAYKDKFGSYDDRTIKFRAYNLEDFIYSFSEISQIQFKGFDERKSIFNPNFTKRTRWIKKNVDYDNR